MGISERRAELLDSRGAYGDGGMIAKPVRGIRRDVAPPRDGTPLSMPAGGFYVPASMPSRGILATPGATIDLWIPFGDHPLKLERYRED